MSKNLFIGIDGKARKAKEIYVGIDGKARKVIKAYIGDENGKARLYWEKEDNIAENSLEFASDNSFTINATKLWDGTIEYNNGNGWTTWTGSSVASTVMDNKYRIYFRGSNNTYIMGTNGSKANAWKITGSNVECNGNLWNLLDYNTVKQDNIPTHAKYCFYHMFDSCEALVKVPALGTKYTNNTKIFRAPQYCYAYMFYGCSNILEPAELISRTIDSYCYLAMYQNCIKLTKSVDFSWPSLASNAQYCYSHMFYGCSNLEEVKDLGTKCGFYFFYRTFSHCDSIRIIPDIIQPNRGANSYDKNYYTYQEAFSYCSRLKRYPTITTGKTETVYNYAPHFYKMFLGCSCPIYDSTARGRIPYIIPEDKQAASGTIQYFWGDEDNSNNITLNKTYYIKDIDYTIISTPTQYLTFSSEKPFSISNGNILGKVFYSTDKSNWYSWGNEAEPAKLNQDTGKYEIYFAGENNLSLFDNFSISNKIQGFIINSENNSVRCDGNINTLLDHRHVENNEELDYSSYTFAGLFQNCSALVSAPSLPNTTLASNCYEGMFYGCSNLKEAPSLPATILTSSCYTRMFQNSAITEAPSLPATTLAFHCYGYMLSGTPITTAPVLPATTLPDGTSNTYDYGVYQAMFMNCKKLVEAPKLPATTLGTSCYRQMFYGCSSLTTAPALLATTLAKNCYRGMFTSCSNLIKIPALPAATLLSYCYSSMFRDCPKVKPATAQSNDYPVSYRVPIFATGTAESTSMTDMFSSGTEANVEYRVNTTYWLPRGATVILS